MVVRWSVGIRDFVAIFEIADACFCLFKVISFVIVDVLGPWSVGGISGSAKQHFWRIA